MLSSDFYEKGELIFSITGTSMGPRKEFVLREVIAMIL